MKVKEVRSCLNRKSTVLSESEKMNPEIAEQIVESCAWQSEHPTSEDCGGAAAVGCSLDEWFILNAEAELKLVVLEYGDLLK